MKYHYIPNVNESEFNRIAKRVDKYYKEQREKRKNAQKQSRKSR